MPLVRLRRVLGALILSAAPAAAQSVSPPIAEHRGPSVKSSFTVGNESLFPLTVVLQPRGFVVNEDGALADVPLDTARVHLKLSTLSFRLQPRQTYTVFYEVKADTLPAWFNIWSGITGARTPSGLNLRIELPHVVYVSQKERLSEADVRITTASWRPSRRQVVVELENASPRLGRAQRVVLQAEKQPTQEAAAFPLFPESRRRVVVPWEAPVPPQSVEVRFEGFAVRTTSVATDSIAVPDSVAPPAADTTRRAGR